MNGFRRRFVRPGGWIPDRRAAVALLTLAVAGSHAVRAGLSHEGVAFARLASSAALAVSASLVIPRGRSGGSHLARRITAAGSLFVILTLPHWAEGELAGGHSLLATGDIAHDLWQLGAVGLALYVCAVVAGAELLVDLFRRHR